MMYSLNININGVSNGRKRRPAGTPDPDAEVVSLSPKTLLESGRYVCEICNQGFQRDQNLQMHRRRHKVPWKLHKRDQNPARAKINRVFVCPEETCLHHDPKHALGDLVGIKKHFRRKHSSNKPWVCERCSKGYAVQSDYKAHVRTCGTRGHSCDCGRVFSRVESFIEHQDSCTNIRHHNPPPEASSSPTASSSTTPSMEQYSNFSAVSVPSTSTTPPTGERDQENIHHRHNLELQLLPSSTKIHGDQNDDRYMCKKITSDDQQQLNFAVAEENGFAEEAVRRAEQQIELAELEFAKAERIRQQALADLEKVRFLEEQYTKKISSTILEITCHACKQKFLALTRGTSLPTAAESSSAMNYVPSAKLKLKKLID